MPLVLLIRHAENQFVKNGRLAGRLPGVLLNENGLQQAQAVAEKLSQVPIKAIYSSPLERTIQTAQPVAKAHQLVIIPRPGLLEIDYGEWEGKTLKALRRRKLWRLVQQDPEWMRFPGGESFAEAQLRISQEIQDLCRRHAERDIFACVSHADPIKLAIAFFLGLPLDRFQQFAIAPASISALLFKASNVRLLTLNYDPNFSFSKL